MRQLATLATGLALAAAASCAWADDIHLVCDGIARHREARSAYVFGQSGGHWGSANAISSAPVEDDAEVFVDIIGDGGRIKVPPMLTPGIRSTSDEGWRALKDVKLGDTEINAKFTFNVFDNPSVTINRVTGHIELAGFGRGFSGDCKPYDASAAARKF